MEERHKPTLWVGLLISTQSSNHAMHTLTASPASLVVQPTRRSHSHRLTNGAHCSASLSRAS